MATQAGPGTGKTTGVDAPGRARIAARTLRTDGWRASPNYTALILLFFIGYSLIRIFMNGHFYVAQFHYLTPMYSPCVSENCAGTLADGTPWNAADFGTWLPMISFPIPMAILIFPILAGFRSTCYYYRKAGYRSLWSSPRACAVPEPHGRYTGETRLPLIFMNYHRYFFWLAAILLLVNTFDALKAASHHIGLGTLIMTVNVVMLWLYSLSCHACRHAVGGRINNFSKHPLRYKMWTGVSKLNPKHGEFAMASLVTVIGTDVYIMTLSLLADGGANTLPGWL
jgi:hypothetical protein